MLMDSCSSRLHLAMLLVEISIAGEPSRIVDWSFPAPTCHVSWPHVASPFSSLAVHSLAMARSTLTVLPDASKCSVEKPTPGRYSAPTCISSVEPTSPFVSPAKSEGGSLRTLRSAMATRRSPLRRSGRSSAGPPCTTLVITICPSTRFSNSMPSHPGAFLPSLSCFPSTLAGFQFGTLCLILKSLCQYSSTRAFVVRDKKLLTISNSKGRCTSCHPSCLRASVLMAHVKRVTPVETHLSTCRCR